VDGTLTDSLAIAASVRFGAMRMHGALTESLTLDANLKTSTYNKTRLSQGSRLGPTKCASDGDRRQSGEGILDGHLGFTGRLQAYTDAPIFAQTSGYLKAWHFDIGAKLCS
jgi:hypothetical protein